MSERISPPRLAVRLLERRLPAEITDAICGDLEEEYKECRALGVSRLRADVWYWGQALTVRVGALRRAAKSLQARRPALSAGGWSGRRGRWGRSGISWLDVKLGLRMLVKYPGMTAVSVFALAIAIPAGLGPMHFMNAVLTPLPVDEGDRIQVLRNINLETSRPVLASSEDYVRWRDELASFEAMGAATIRVSYNVMSDDGRAAPVPSAELTASAFDVLRVRALLGRTFIPADEVIGAPEVALIGYDFWQSRLDGDPDVVGRSIRIGGVPHTIVGVMPEGFLFPFQDQLWLPLRVNMFTEVSGDEGRHLVFGRLAADVSAEEAQAEVTGVGRRLAIEFPGTHERLEAEVLPFALGYFGMPKSGWRSMPQMYVLNVLALMVLVVACANIAMLIFTRTATRAGELAVRSALGASRTRIVSQLFTEALVFAVLAAGMGLLFGDWLSGRFEWILRLAPYWTDLGVTRVTAFWALSLAVLSAGVVGVIPALKVTGKGVQQNIQRAAAGRSGVRFGGISSALIVVDVALAVATVGLAVGLWEGLREPPDGMGRLSEQFLAAELSIPQVARAADVGAIDPDELASRLGATQQELVRRLEAEPGVRGVAVGSVVPGGDLPRRATMEWDGQDPSEASEGPDVRYAYFDPGFFEVLQRPILSGRGFDSSDQREGASTVIVNTAFVDRVLGGRNPIGRRVRYTTSAGEEPGPWYEIVGVVGDLGLDDPMSPGRDAGVYHPLVPGEIQLVRLAIHIGDDPESFIPRLRALASDVDPTALISNPMALDKVRSPDAEILPWIILGVVILTGILLALSASGIYALMSFTVAERTREIGIRTALGAKRNRVVFTVAKRALVQLGVGIVLGVGVAAWILSQFASGGRIPTESPLLLSLILGVGVMAVIGLLACTAPTLRALRIKPTEALRGGG